MSKDIIDLLPTDVIITGIFENGIVTVAGNQLLPERSQKLVNHSPDGFGWGYGGSGPSQLSLAILLLFMPPELALKYYQRFKWNVVSQWPKDQFIQHINIREEIYKIEAQWAYMKNPQ